ncbi:4613_t:CDS:1, partial [Acaulospora colombiana]
HHAFTSSQQSYHQHHAFSHHPPQAFMTSHGYTSPTQSNTYASPPPQSVVDEHSISPINETLPSGAIRGNGKMAMKRR